MIDLLDLQCLKIFSFLNAEAEGALDKARKHKKRQLEDTLNLVLKKRKVMTPVAWWLDYLIRKITFIVT